MFDAGFWVILFASPPPSHRHHVFNTQNIKVIIRDLILVFKALIIALIPTDPIHQQVQTDAISQFAWFFFGLDPHHSYV